MSSGMQKLAAGVIAGAAIAGFAVPASAGASVVAHRHSASASTLAAPEHQLGAAKAGSNDQFLAGWYAFTSGGLASASTTFRVPTATCPASGTTDLGFGVFGIQAGASDLSYSSQANVQLDCAGGVATYYISAFTTGDGNDYVPTNPGDLVVTSLYENGTNTTATVHDLTTHVTVTSTGASDLDDQVNTGSYNYFYSAPSTISGFGKVKFTEAQVNGDYLKYSNPQQLNMAGVHPVQIATGALTAAGDGFTQTFRHF